MPNVPLPDNLMNEHMNWHMYPGQPEMGGRSINPWLPGATSPTPGSGLEFLTFHQNFLAQFHAWYDNQPFADPAAVAPWLQVPDALKQVPSPPLDPSFVWSQDWASQEDRIENNPLSFQSSDELGMFIEWGLHALLHNASAIAFNEQILADPTTAPSSTYFYEIHGLIEGWWIAVSNAHQPTVTPAVQPAATALAEPMVMANAESMTPPAKANAQPTAASNWQGSATQQSRGPHLRYELTAENIQITYELNSSTFKPELAYHGPAGNLTFTGDGIDSRESELGAELAVTLKKTIDTGFTTLTLVLASLDMGRKSSQKFHTFAVETNHLLGMELLKIGVHELYKVYNLQGTAKIVY